MTNKLVTGHERAFARNRRAARPGPFAAQRRQGLHHRAKGWCGRHQPVLVKTGIEGFGTTPAGTTGTRRHTAGHHHVLIDLDALPGMDKPIPEDASHVHLDGGETEVLLELPSGEHSLQHLLGDEEHEPHAPPLISKKIRITVK